MQHPLRSNRHRENMWILWSSNAIKPQAYISCLLPRKVQISHCIYNSQCKALTELDHYPKSVKSSYLTIVTILFWTHGTASVCETPINPEYLNIKLCLVLSAFLQSSFNKPWTDLLAFACLWAAFLQPIYYFLWFMSLERAPEATQGNPPTWSSGLS